MRQACHHLLLTREDHGACLSGAQRAGERTLSRQVAECSLLDTRQKRKSDAFKHALRRYHQKSETRGNADFPVPFPAPTLEQ